MKNKIASLILCALFLVGCGSGGVPKAKTIAAAMNYITEAKNYTVEVTIQKGSNVSSFSHYYSEKIYSYNLEYGLINGKNGVYVFDYYLDQFTVSELLTDDSDKTYTTFWGNSLIPSLADFKAQDFASANGTEFKVTSKMAKLTFLDITNIDAANYENIIDFNMTMPDGLESLEFVMDIKNNTKVTAKLFDIKKTKIDEAEQYLKSGKDYFVPDAGLARFRQLFAGFNYSHPIFDDNTGDVVAYEFFNPHYYIPYCIDDNYASTNPNCNVGYIGLNNFTAEGITLNGMFYFVLRPFRINPLQLSDNSNIAEVFNYPSYLQLFSFLQYFKPVDQNKYVTYHPVLIEDFVNNFQIGDYVAGYNLVSLEVNCDLAEADEDSIIMFTLNVSISGKVYSMEFLFVGFNSIFIAEVENVVKWD